MPIKIKSVSGSVTLSAENTSGDQTLTVPSLAGGKTLLTSDGSGASLTSLPPPSAGTVTETMVHAAAVNAFKSGRKNLIINGGMNVAQRATSVTSTNSISYHTVDRFDFRGGATGVYTIEQSTDAPANFKNSTKITVTTPDTSIPNTSRYWVSTNLEGNDISHLNLGTSDAQQFTLSFYVKSSLTGTFSGGFTNDNFTRAYAFSYNISSANTWERKEITLTGDTSGTWLTTNSAGIRIIWSLGWGVDRDQSAGAWSANGNVAVTGTVQVIATDNATFQITGAQLELGSTATDFEHRSYGEELALCQRYFAIVGDSAEPGDEPFGLAACRNTSEASVFFKHPVEMRTGPSLVEFDTPVYRQNGTTNGNTTSASYPAGIDQGYKRSTSIQIQGFSGLPAGEATSIKVTSGGKLGVDAEL